jgi:hypothetical protein
MDRREFCLSSAAAAIAGAAGSLVCAGGARLYKFIYDRRYPAGRAFGTAAGHAVTTAGRVAVDGDITALWSRDLRLHWSAGGAAVAGMTTAQTLFCLEQLAKDHWMRVVIRAEHRISGGRTTTHRVTAAEPVLARMQAALAAADWPTRIPGALMTYRSAQAAPRMTFEIAAPRDRWTITDDALVSFVIA